jgi:hypothetical protein
MALLLWLIVFAAPLFVISLSKENFHPDRFFKVVVENYYAFQLLSKPGGAIQFSDLQPTIWSFIFHAPWALISGMFRPFIWEANNLLQLVVAMENILLLFFLITSLRNWKQFLQSSDRLLILSVVIYILLLCIFLTLSTPNFGTLSRYRIGFLPFIFFLVMIDNPVISYFTKIVQRSFSRLVR